MHNSPVPSKFNLIDNCYLRNRNSCRNVWCRLRVLPRRYFYHLDINGNAYQSKCYLEEI